MADDQPEREYTVPESIQEILWRMGPDDRRELTAVLREEHDLIRVDTREEVLFEPAATPPSPVAIRAATLCDAITEIDAEE
ncbi:MAG: hypothetical protein QXG03_07770 [Halalkalicoccus sp.]